MFAVDMFVSHMASTNLADSQTAAPNLLPHPQTIREPAGNRSAPSRDHNGSELFDDRSDAMANDSVRRYVQGLCLRALPPHSTNMTATRVWSFFGVRAADRNFSCQSATANIFQCHVMVQKLAAF